MDLFVWQLQGWATVLQTDFILPGSLPVGLGSLSVICRRRQAKCRGHTAGRASGSVQFLAQSAVRSRVREQLGKVASVVVDRCRQAMRHMLARLSHQCGDFMKSGSPCCSGHTLNLDVNFADVGGVRRSTPSTKPRRRI